MSAKTSILNLNADAAAATSRRSRILAIILMIAIAGIFWVDSRYPANKAISHRVASQGCRSVDVWGCLSR
jgi:hypothetical protein